MAVTLAERLRQLRKIKQLTLRDVEDKTGVSNGYLNQLEQGKIKEPSPHILHKLAEVYGIRYEALLQLAGYLSLANDKSGRSKRAAGVAFSLTQDLTAEEEEELLKYLEFIRDKKRKKA